MPQGKKLENILSEAQIHMAGQNLGALFYPNQYKELHLGELGCLLQFMILIDNYKDFGYKEESAELVKLYLTNIDITENQSMLQFYPKAQDQAEQISTEWSKHNQNVKNIITRYHILKNLALRKQNRST